VLVAIYSKSRDVVNFFHWKSSSCGGGSCVVILSTPKCNISIKVSAQCVYVIGVCSDLFSDFVLKVWDKTCVF
jgi:hypothetical protein